MQYGSSQFDRKLLDGWARTQSWREHRGSCSSTVSCPTFNRQQCDPEEEALPRTPSSHSSPSLQSSVSSLQSSSSSLPSSSSSLRSCSGDSSFDTNSWSSGATCLLRSAIRQHREEVFCMRQSEATCDPRTGYPNDGPAGNSGRRDSVQSASSSQKTSAASEELEQKIEAKLKFSQFLDEVTCRVLDPSSLEAFGVSHRAITHPIQKWCSCLPSCTILSASEETRKSQEPVRKVYLETDIDCFWRSSDLKGEVKEALLEKNAGAQRNSCDRVKPAHPLFSLSNGFTKCIYKTPYPRPSSSRPSEGEMQSQSSVQEQKEDLRKRLTCTTHKLELLETEFDSTRQYLETELRRAQEELEKFTEKLRRIQNSYAALQRINQDLEEKMHRTSKHHEEEKRALSREIILLNNHLMEAKVTIEKLREDNEVYRKDCNLAVQLLQCRKAHYRAPKLSELPTDLQQLVTLHLEKPSCGTPRTHSPSPYPEAVSSSLIAQVLEKKLDGAGITHPTLPPRSSELCCSDTALYCPEQRQPRRRHSEDLQVPPVGQDNLPTHLTSSSCSSCSGGPGGTLSSYMDWRDAKEYEEEEEDEEAEEEEGVSYTRASSSSACFFIPCEEEEEELNVRWRRMSMEDDGRSPSFTFSRGHIPLGTAVHTKPLYGSFQQRPREGSQESEPSVFHSGSSGDRDRDSSTESLPPRFPGLQRHTSPQYQGLCRKDSLTKAQLYGTLLN